MLGMVLAAEEPIELLYLYESTKNGVGSVLGEGLQRYAHREVMRLLTAWQERTHDTFDYEFGEEIGDPQSVIAHFRNVVISSTDQQIGDTRLLLSCILLGRAIKSEKVRLIGAK
ncbi:MAG: hypothetical protein QNJ09_10735 [Paracoccaceae bacterium]|nr:hypothetical protein [Paracoccaceae bacterium]